MKKVRTTGIQSLSGLWRIGVALLSLLVCDGLVRGAQSVTLAWDPNAEIDLAGYNTYWGSQSGNYTNKVDVGKVTTNTVSGLVAGVTYYFAVTAYNTSALESDFSNEITYLVPGGTNTPPTLNAINNLTIAEDAGIQTVNLSGIGSGASNEVQTLTVTATSSNPGLIPNPTVTYSSPSATGSLTFSSVTNASGTATITVVVNDGQSISNTISRAFNVTVTAVNDPPLLSNIANQVVDANKTTAAIPFTVQDAETAASSLVVQATSSNQTLLPNAQIVLGGTGTNRTLTLSPASNQSGTATITVSVSDGVASNVKTFTLTVQAYNLPPTLNAINNLTIAEDAGIQTVNLSGIGPGASNEVQTLTVTATSSNPGLIPNPTVTYSSPSATGSLTFSSVTNASGSAVITVVVNDGQSISNTISRAFTVTVTAVNDPPLLSNIANQVVDANKTTAAIPFTVQDAETAASNLVVQATSSNQTLLPNAQIVLGGAGTNRTLTLSPASNQSGTATITVSASDGVASTVKTFTLVVQAYNLPPTLNAINNLTIAEDAGIQTVNLSGIGSGASNEVQTLTVTATSSNPGLIPNPTVTYTSPSATGTLTLSSVTNASGTATITVVVNDGQSFTNTISRAFNVTVNAVNDAPLLSDIPNQAINRNKTSAAIPFTVQDTETVDSNLAVQASSSNPTLIPNAQLVLGGAGTNRTITLSPAANQSGTATITISVGDGLAVTAKAFVLTVTSSNNAPVITLPIGLVAKQSRSYSIQGLGVSDVDGGPGDFNLSLSVGNGTLLVATDVAQGVSASQVSANNSGAVLIVAPLNAIRATLGNSKGIGYTGNLGFAGDDTLRGTINDNGQTGLGGALSHTAQTVITVTANGVQKWRTQTFSQAVLTDPSTESTVWGDNADADKDGRENLLEFALGLDPQRSDSDQGALETGIVEIGGSKYASLVFRRRKNEPILSYVPEVSADGQVWNSGSNVVKEISVTGLDSVFEAVVCQDLAPILPSNPRYIRLRVVNTDL